MQVPRAPKLRERPVYGQRLSHLQELLRDGRGMRRAPALKIAAAVLAVSGALMLAAAVCIACAPQFALARALLSLLS